MLEELKDANSYIIGKIVEKDSLILEMEDFAHENNVPIVTKEVAEYLKFIVKTHKVKNILEVGTAIGYSGILMAKEIVEQDGKLYTIEIDEERYNQAQENIKKSGLSNIVSIKGDAVEEIKKIEENFDFVFIDASKGHYMDFFEDSIKLLNKNGIIFIDNIMFRGYLYKEYPKRFKTIVKRLDSFIDSLYNREDGDFVLLPFGDGVGEEKILLDKRLDLLADGEYIDQNQIIVVPAPEGLLKKDWDKETHTWKEGATDEELKDYYFDNINRFKAEILEVGFDFNGHQQKCREKDLALLGNAIAANEDAQVYSKTPVSHWSFNDHDVVEMSLEDLKHLRIAGATFVQTIFLVEAQLKSANPDILLSKESFINKVDELCVVKCFKNLV